MSVGLVLEGGGMRGIFTAGVLDYFLEKELYAPYVVGVSAGACHGSSYVSKQKLRSKRVTIDYSDHPEYLSWHNLIRKREFFGMDLLFHDIPLKHEPFDFEAFFTSDQTFKVGVTDCHTGKSLYYESQQNYEVEDVLTQLRASCSIPYFAPVVEYDSHHLLDGGIADPIPIRQSEKDGNERNIVVLTQDATYRKSPPGISKVFRHGYRHYPNLVEAILNRHNHYNETKEYVYDQSKKGATYVIQPPIPLEVSRFGKDKNQLEAAYRLGYETAKKEYVNVKAWME